MQNKNLSARNNANVAHNWAHNTGSVKTGSSFYYDDNSVIYSFGSHFPIAKRIDSETYYYTLQTWSGSYTARHKNHTRQAIPIGATIIYMRHIPIDTNVPYHAINFKYWIDALTIEISSVNKARNKTKYINSISSIVAEIVKYCRYFNCNFDTCENYMQLRELITTWENTDTTTILETESKKNTARLEQKYASAVLAYSKNVEKFRNFEVSHVDRPYQIANQNNSTFGYTELLRYNVNTDTFETSLQVNIPANTGLRFYNNCILNTCKDCTTFLGYAVKAITPDYIIVGCHKITIEEIHNVVKAYNDTHTKGA